jgi:hypothetical protein
MTTTQTSPAASQQAALDAALLILERMGLSPDDLTATPRNRATGMAWLNTGHLPVVLQGRTSTTPAVSPAILPERGSASPGGLCAAEGSKARTRRLAPWRSGSAPSCDRHIQLLFIWRQEPSANAGESAKSRLQQAARSGKPGVRASRRAARLQRAAWGPGASSLTGHRRKGPGPKRADGQFWA